MFVSKRKKIYRYGLLAFLVLDLVVLGILAWSRLQREIPDKIWTYVGREELLTNSSLIKYSKKEEKAVEALHINQTSDKTTVVLEGVGMYEVKARLFGVLPVKDIQVQAIEPIEVAPSGEPVGIYVETKGLLVLSTTSVEGTGWFDS